MKMNSHNGQVLMNGLKNYMNRNVSHNRYINSVVANAGFGGMGMGMKTAAGIAGIGMGIAGAGYAYNKSRGDRTLGGNTAIGMGAGIAGMGLHGLGAGRLLTGAGMKTLGKKVTSMGRRMDDNFIRSSIKSKEVSKGMYSNIMRGTGIGMQKAGNRMTSMGNSFRGHMGTLQSSKFAGKAAPYMSKAQGLFNKGRDSINDRFRI